MSKYKFISITGVTALLAVPSLARAHDVNKYPEHTLSGDFNGDGKLDRLVTRPRVNNNMGQVELWIGDGSHKSLWWRGAYTNAWPKAPMVLTEDDPIFAGAGALNNFFGSGTVVGDFDGDGKDDIAFSSPGAAVDGYANAGLVYVLYGADLVKNGPTWSYTMASVYQQGGGGVRGVLEASDYFGEFLGVGDLDCNGIDDLIIGVPREDFTVNGAHVYNGGAVHVLYGAAVSGLTTVGDEYFNQLQLGGTTQGWDYFGAALTAGRFETGDGGIQLAVCDTLAVGTPGKNINGKSGAGAVYTSRGAPSGLSLVGQLWHQDVNGIDGTTSNNEHFGSRLGTASLPLGEDLWIEVPGESCSDADDRRFQVIRAGASGLTTNGNVRFCSRHEPGLRDTEAGWLVQKQDQYGPYMQYLPSGVDESSRVMVVVHGMPPELEAGEDSRWHAAAEARFYIQHPKLIELAEQENLILIAPGFSVTAFASNGLADDHPAKPFSDASDLKMSGGYRQLFGRDIAADEWVNLIVDSYKAVDLAPTGKLYIYGQSAGAQMVSRYITRNDDRVIRAALTSPNTVALPYHDKVWGAGLAAVTNLSTRWLNDQFGGPVEKSYSVSPNPSKWAAGLSKPIFISVGGLEQDPWTPGDTHVTTAIEYRNSAKRFTATSGVELCIVPDMLHSYSGSLPRAIEFLFPTGNPPICAKTSAAWAYAWSQHPSSSHTANWAYSRNSSGGEFGTGVDNTITHLETGKYRVRFPGLGTANGGHVQVTAHGAGSERCKVLNWYNSTGGVEASVNCFTAAGAPVDSRFNIAYVRKSGIGSTQEAYLWANNPTSASYTPNAAYQFNSSTAQNTVARQGTGLYAVTLPGQNMAGGTAEVTAYGASSDYCKVSSWSQSGNNAVVNVRCFDTTGALSDSQFNLNFANAASPNGALSYSYALANNAVSASYTPSVAYQKGFVAGSYDGDVATQITAGRTSTGRYFVDLPGMSSTGSSVHVTAYGSGSEHCKVVSWQGNETNTNANVACFNASGALTDTRFVIVYTDDKRLFL